LHGNGAAPSIAHDIGLPTLGQALEVARDRVIINIDMKDTPLIDRVAQFVIAAGMAHQVFIKTQVANQHDIDAVRASWHFGKIAFVPVLQAYAGRFSDDLRALEQLGAQMYEVEFSDIAVLQEGRTELDRQGARLWVNTIEASHSLDFNDARAAIHPDAVWGRLLQAGVGAIQTDTVAQLVTYLTQQGRR
jgi:glycerophosphoryl diester phosphodiesterase